jgi:hypothetical protein
LKNRWQLMGLLLVATAIATYTQAEEPERVRPSTGTSGGLRKASTALVHSLGERLDDGHDWLYRRLQRLLESTDTRFSGSGPAPLVVPLSPFRIGIAGEFLHGRDGLTSTARPEFEATLRLPNLQRRLKVFVTSTDLSESPADTTLERSPLRAGVRYAPLTHIDFDIGVRVKLRPAAFAALRWAPKFDAGTVRVYPFAKPYVESGLGLGASGGVALEHWSGRWITRSASYANWVRNTSATDWSQTIVLGYARALIQEQRYDRFATGHDLACGVALRASVSGDRVTHATLYETSALFKRPLHGGWLYGYVEPLVRWERASGWHPDAGVRIGIDALFWGLSSLPAEVANYCT